MNRGSRLGQEVGLDILKSCPDMKPDLAMEHSTMAYFMLEKGSIKAAKIELEKALRLNPGDGMALRIKERLKKR